MPNENDSNTPSADPDQEPLSQPPMAQTAPHQNELRKDAKNGPQGKDNETVKELEKDIRAGEHWLIRIGAAGVIMNVVIALIYFGQLKEMRKATGASTQAANAATTTATAAQSQLGKMEESNKINREALETVQRAYVTFPPEPQIALMNFPNGPVYLLGMPIENAGNTQAHALKDRVSWIPTMGPLRDDYTFPDRTGKYGSPWAATGANIIPAKGGMLSQTVQIDEKFLNEFVQQNAGPWPDRFGVPSRPSRDIVFYGWATYRDIFENTPEHLSEFCRALTSLAVQAQHVQATWGYCPWHNCTDKDCPDYEARINESHASPTYFSTPPTERPKK